MSDAATDAQPPSVAPPGRDLPTTWLFAIGVFCAILSLLHLALPFATWFSPITRALFDVGASPSELTRNAAHFAGFALLAAVLTPAIDIARARESAALRWLDLVFGLAVAASALYLAATVEQYYENAAFSTAQWIAGGLVVFGGLELTRRTAGVIVPILAVIAMSYIFLWGAYAPAPFTFGGLSIQTALVAAIYEDAGMFGTLARISSTTVFLFIIFGAFLVRSGAGDFVVMLARAIAGRFVGGPGLIAVIASGLTGTISGSAVANTASTGVVTIPLMKRAGFPARCAAAVEASASTGGQLMPPIMGAGAFVMASYTNIPYDDIILAAALPAFFYFGTVALFVRIEALKQGLGTFESADQVSLGRAVYEGGASFILPISAVVGCLLVGFTPSYAAVVGVATIIASSWLTKTPMGVTAVIEALIMGARNMVMMAVLLCTIGLIVNAIVKAGVGNTFSLMVVEWSSGNLLIAIALVAVASLVLGMGLPVTAAYIVLATLSAPALAGMIANADVAALLASGGLDDATKAVISLGAPEAAAALSEPMTLSEAKTLVASLPFEIQTVLRDQLASPAALVAALLSAHMIVFWLSQDSNVTPPVCLAAFTAAAIAGSPPMRTGLVSWKIAKGLYVAPVLFAYTPWLSGDFLTAIQICAFALIGVYGIAAALEGWMEGPLPIWTRPIAGAAGLAALWPGHLVLNLIAAGAILLLFISSLRRARRSPG